MVNESKCFKVREKSGNLIWSGKKIRVSVRKSQGKLK